MDIKTKINKTGDRLTKQRQAILEYLESVYSHPTAEVVYKNVKKRVPNISLGTVYRNLEYLHSHGYILEITSLDNKSHYDALTQNHDHFICESCNSILDLKSKIKTKTKCSVGKIKSNINYYFGICNKCLNK
ncbi:MAG: Fur family transcriptional regulator [Candidatus Komeilibacteria bacterium]